MEAATAMHRLRKQFLMWRLLYLTTSRYSRTLPSVAVTRSNRPRLVPFFAGLTSILTTSPGDNEFLFQPTRCIADGLPISSVHRVTLPDSSLTSHETTP